jgi:hypothetical protein
MKQQPSASGRQRHLAVKVIGFFGDPLTPPEQVQRARIVTQLGQALGPERAGPAVRETRETEALGGSRSFQSIDQCRPLLERLREPSERVVGLPEVVEAGHAQSEIVSGLGDLEATATVDDGLLLVAFGPVVLDEEGAPQAGHAMSRILP